MTIARYQGFKVVDYNNGFIRIFRGDKVVGDVSLEYGRVFSTGQLNNNNLVKLCKQALKSSPQYGVDTSK